MHDLKSGTLFVLGSAIVWSFGGAIARFISVDDAWTIVFWRATWGALFLLGFLLARDGLSGTIRLFQKMGLPGIGVALCFATASSTFILALSYTTVANILLIQAGVPLIAALLGRLLFGERVAPATWLAIAAVILGVVIMVSDSLDTGVSLIGNALSVLIALAFATATVITRHYANVRMTPACCLGTLLSAAVSAALADGFYVSARDMGLLFTFGALNLGLGLALFATGARAVPAAVTALIGTTEPVLAPLWVWLIHNEVPSQLTLVGGSIIVLALLMHLLWQLRVQRSALSETTVSPGEGTIRLIQD
jgi:drug/metabolite transporter (DMT)-like permease